MDNYQYAFACERHSTADDFNQHIYRKPTRVTGSAMRGRQYYLRLPWESVAKDFMALSRELLDALRFAEWDAKDADRDSVSLDALPNWMELVQSHPYVAACLDAEAAGDNRSSYDSYMNIRSGLSLHNNDGLLLEFRPLGELRGVTYDDTMREARRNAEDPAQ